MKLVSFWKMTAVALLVCASNSISADTVVFDNGAGGAAGVLGGSVSDLSVTSSGQVIIYADDFILGNASTITEINWTGFYFDNSPQTDFFTVSLYGDNNGAPQGGPPLTSFEFGDPGNLNLGTDLTRVDSGIDLNGFDIYEYTAATNFNVAADTVYWISIANNTSLFDPDDWWSWGVTIDFFNPGNGHASLNGGASWINESPVFSDFRLIGISIPEPGSAACLISGLGIMLLARIRRGNANNTINI